MAEVNIYYDKQTNSWWINKDLDGFSFKNYINEHPVGLGSIEFNTNDESQIKDFYKIASPFIPDYIKKLNGITEEIEKNEFENAIQVSEEELKDLLT